MNKWADIAKRFGGTRTGKQCRERWFNQINPELKRTAWTEREDYLLLKTQAEYGNCWKRISQALPGRRLETSTVLYILNNNFCPSCAVKMKSRTDSTQRKSSGK